MSAQTDKVEPVRRFIVDNFLFGRSEALSDEQSFLDNGIIDSTGILELVAFLEGTYGLRVNDDELIPDNLDSINKISGFLQAKIGK